jgi:predicted nuclease of predicted toxin-antitoxin system
MKLLFDENLSPRLAWLLRDVYPGSEHLETAGMRGQSDQTIWDYARQHSLVIVSKDNDFRQRSFLFGPPPKVIWLDVGNAGTDAIAKLLVERSEIVCEYLMDNELGLLVLKAFD